MNKQSTRRLAAWLMMIAVGLGLNIVGIVNAAGPDVTVHDLFGGSGLQNWGVSGGIRGYSVGTTSCNVGDAPLNWCDESNLSVCQPGSTSADHPIIGQNMYRLKNNRFEQIGASWLKHGFFSLNETTDSCRGAGNETCQFPPHAENQLGVGCTDPYTASLNGSRPLGRRSEVNPTTGAYPFPHGGGTGIQSQPWNQRVAVAQSDLDSASNVGARYFVEGHYIAPDDASQGNGLNNATYSEVTVNPSTFNLTIISTFRTQPAIKAWSQIDMSVESLDLDIPGSAPVQRFHVARKVTEVVPGTQWHYEYAIHNMNSARAADQLHINFFGSDAVILNTGFRDVNAHSGEPYDTTDWTITSSSSSVSWQAPTFATPENANALRWGTTYSFWFDANKSPSQIASHQLELFQDGIPASVTFLGNEEIAAFADGFEGNARRTGF